MLSVALAAIALGAVTVAPASAAHEGNKIVEIRSAAEGLCLDFSRTDTTYAGLGACTGSAAQQFERIPTATGGSYLRNIGDGRCLDGHAATVLMVLCEHGITGQRFQEVPDADGTVKLSAPGRFGTRFVDSVLYPGYGQLTTFEDSPRISQRWLVREVGVVPPPQPGAVVKLKQAREGTCVADSDTRLNELKPCATAPGFERIDAGAGQVVLRSQASGKCLTALGDTAVGLEDCDTTAPGQQWMLSGDELGNYTVTNAGRYLTSWRNSHVKALEPWSVALTQHWKLPAA